MVKKKVNRDSEEFRRQGVSLTYVQLSQPFCARDI